jgi:uncharacterized tellurite resistance protein B-like protein
MTDTPPYSLAPVQLEAIYNLFAAVVLADRRIHDNEVEAHATALEKVFASIGQEKVFHGTAVKQWLLENANDIVVKMTGSEGKVWLARQFLLLRDFPSRQLFLEKLWEVAISDENLHRKEAELIDLAVRLWR